MKSRSLLSILMLVFVLSACNLPSNVPVTETPTSAFTASPTLFLSTTTPSQTAPPPSPAPPTTTSTPAVPVAFPKDVAVNCRLGPGTGWVVLSGLNQGASSQIVGRSGDSGWWQIIDPFNSARRCWVATSVTNTAGNVASIPVVEAPKATVTNVTVDVDPESISVAGCLGPVLPLKLTGTIETDGPTAVQWHFETQQGGALAAQTTQFDAFGSKPVSAEFPPTLAAGTYWVRLIVTSPNNTQAETNYTIVCS